MISLQTATWLALLASFQTAWSDPLDRWTPTNPLPQGLHLGGLTYGKGQFVGIGTAKGTNTVIVSSLDAESWVQRLVIPPNGNFTIGLYRIDFANGLFVAVGGIFGDLVFGGAILTSSDAVTWIPHHFPGTSWLRDVAYGNGRFVAAGGRQTAASVDGTTWQFHDTDAVATRITFGDRQFVAISSDSVATSADGMTWLQLPVHSEIPLQAVTYGAGRFVAVGGDLGDFRGTAWTSVDAENWTEHRSDLLPPLQAVTFGNGQFLALGAGGEILSSTDAVNWAQRPGAVDPIRSMTYGGGRFVGLVQGVSGTTVLKSERVTSLLMAPSSGSVWSPISVLVQGKSGQGYSIQTSTDLKTWQEFTTMSPVDAEQVLLFNLPVDGNYAHRFYRATSP